jgi:hypothetical protein
MAKSMTINSNGNFTDSHREDPNRIPSASGELTLLLQYSLESVESAKEGETCPNRAMPSPYDEIWSPEVDGEYERRGVSGLDILLPLLHDVYGT